MKNSFILKVQIIIAICLFTIGCPNEQAQHDRQVQTANKISYWKDSRTNICFASLNLGWDSATMASVPCTPEVERLIK